MRHLQTLILRTPTKTENRRDNINFINHEQIEELASTSYNSFEINTILATRIWDRQVRYGLQAVPNDTLAIRILSCWFALIHTEASEFKCPTSMLNMQFETEFKGGDESRHAPVRGQLQVVPILYHSEPFSRISLPIAGESQKENSRILSSCFPALRPRKVGARNGSCHFHLIDETLGLA